MLSVTAAARLFNVPRDTLLDAVRDGRLEAARDRRGVLRMEKAAVERFCSPATPAIALKPKARVISFPTMPPTRLQSVVVQQMELARKAARGAVVALPSDQAEEGTFSPVRLEFTVTRRAEGRNVA